VPDVAQVFFFRKLKKRNLWPFEDRSGNWEEEDLFDVIEVLHDCASKGVDARHHSYLNCGMHYETFNRDVGQNDFRVAMNEILRDYDKGYVLTANGENLAELDVLLLPRVHTCDHSADREGRESGSSETESLGARQWRTFVSYTSRSKPRKAICLRAAPLIADWR
jgi:hypothetical protein